MSKANPSFIEGEVPIGAVNAIDAQTFYSCPHCKTGGLRIAHELQYEGGCLDAAQNDDQGRHALNLSLVFGTVKTERVIPDPHLLEMLRIPLYCKLCRSSCALVFRVASHGHLYSSLEDLEVSK
jgi:hypothetical protein